MKVGRWQRAIVSHLSLTGIRGYNGAYAPGTMAQGEPPEWLGLV